VRSQLSKSASVGGLSRAAEEAVAELQAAQQRIVKAQRAQELAAWMADPCAFATATAMLRRTILNELTIMTARLEAVSSTPLHTRHGTTQAHHLCTSSHERPQEDRRSVTELNTHEVDATPNRAGAASPTEIARR
jgi:hypothetical protein